MLAAAYVRVASLPIQKTFRAFALAPASEGRRRAPRTRYFPSRQSPARDPFLRVALRVQPLAVDRQAAAMTQTAVATEVHQPLDVHRHFGVEIARRPVVGSMTRGSARLPRRSYWLVRRSAGTFTVSTIFFAAVGPMPWMYTGGAVSPRVCWLGDIDACNAGQACLSTCFLVVTVPGPSSQNAEYLSLGYIPFWPMASQVCYYRIVAGR